MGLGAAGAVGAIAGRPGAGRAPATAPFAGSTWANSDSIEEKFGASASRTMAASINARPLPLYLALRRNSSNTVII
jgi:hypothetical protein